MNEELIVLESMGAASEFITQEGFFSNLKHVRQVKKAAKTEAIRKREESYHKLEAHNGPIVKSIVNKAVAKCKAKKEWKTLPWDIYIHECEGNYDVEVFSDEWCMYEHREQFIPDADKAFDMLHVLIKQGIEASKDKFEGIAEGCPKVEIYEHNLITISLMS